MSEMQRRRLTSLSLFGKIFLEPNKGWGCYVFFLFPVLKPKNVFAKTGFENNNFEYFTLPFVQAGQESASDQARIVTCITGKSMDGTFLESCKFFTKKANLKRSSNFPAMEALKAHPVNPPWVSCGSCFDPSMLHLILHHYTLELHAYKFLSLII